LVDEHLVRGAGNGSSLENLTTSQATTVSQQLINASLNGDYAAIMTQFHVDYINETLNWVTGTLAYAQSQGIPMWNADRWLRFIQTRYGANLQNIRWNGSTSTLTFNLNGAAASGIGLTLLLPASHKGGALGSVRVDGATTPFTLRTIKGQSIAFVNVTSGSHSFSVTYQTTSGPTDTPAPTNTPVGPTPTKTPTAPPGSTTTTIQVTASADDVNEDGGSLTTNAASIWIGGSSNPTSSFTGLRFTHVQVPAGATIVSAHLEFYANFAQWIPLNVQIAGVKSANSAPFTTLRPSQQPLTVARVQHLSDVQWSANTWYKFSEMAPVVQEIVDQTGWQSGNSLAIVVRNTSGVWARKFASSRDMAAQSAPRLVIVYHQ
jgi:hypothetical protein